MLELGYVKGTHFSLVARLAEGNYDRLPAFAEELVKHKVDLIFAASTAALRAAQGATSTIPIVFIYVTDPVGSGFAVSLARPGRNITGLTNITIDLDSKRLQLLKQMLPSLVRVACFLNPRSPFPKDAERMQALAEPLGLHALPFYVSTPEELEPAFTAMNAERAQAFMVSSDSYLFSMRKQIADLALRHRLPSMWNFIDCVQAGGLMSYGGDDSAEMRKVATYVDKIFRGAKPGELPIQQPTKFDLIINRKTANALGLTIPPVLLVQAEKVID